MCLAVADKNWRGVCLDGIRDKDVRLRREQHAWWVVGVGIWLTLLAERMCQDGCVFS